MDNLSLLEECYQQYVSNLDRWMPEGIVDVNLSLLEELGLLDYYNDAHHDPSLTRYFHVVETDEKITLINQEFVIWIVPMQVEETAVTYTLIALNGEGRPQLELAFSSSGVYNTSKLVLRVLEKFLVEIQENEELINKFGQKS